MYFNSKKAKPLTYEQECEIRKIESARERYEQNIFDDAWEDFIDMLKGVK